METKWLEDFLSVAETLNFSRSARLRNVTQPAFCRRIRSLEHWAGADLFDRTAFPVRLTPAGRVFLVHARDMLKQTYQMRSLLRAQAIDKPAVIRFAMLHTLSIAWFPRWLAEIEHAVGRLPSRIEACNTHDAILQLVEGNCDLLMCYLHQDQVLELDGQRYDSLVVGSERIRPYASAGTDGVPRYRLPGSAQQPLPMLSYSSNTVLGRIVGKTLEDDPCQAYLVQHFEGDLAYSLKMMALHGHGVAWLPESAVTREVAAGLLAPALDDDALARDGWSTVVEVRLYRDRDRACALVDRLWNHLTAQHQQRES